MNKIDKSIYENLTLLPADMQGWQSDSTVFHQIIEETKHLNKDACEVGTWKGASAINFANYCRKIGLKTTLHCVDSFLGAQEMWDQLKHTPERNLFLKNGFPQIYYIFLSNVIHNSLQDYILPFPNTSLIASRYFKNNGYEFGSVYIDASHQYDDVLHDLNAYWDLVVDGGIMFGDDYNHWQDVKLAVNEFTLENNLQFEILENNFWVIRK